MTLILCLDDRLGMAFHRRRQSRDRAVSADIAALARGKSLHAAEVSAALFPGQAVRPLAEAKEGDLVFVELEDPAPWAEKASRLIVYRWNRHYPADLRCEIPWEAWRLTESTEFAGTSHETITREVYIHEK